MMTERKEGRRRRKEEEIKKQPENSSWTEPHGYFHHLVASLRLVLLDVFLLGAAFREPSSTQSPQKILSETPICSSSAQLRFVTYFADFVGG